MIGSVELFWGSDVVEYRKQFECFWSWGYMLTYGLIKRGYRMIENVKKVRRRQYIRCPETKLLRVLLVFAGNTSDYDRLVR